jgi:hypothetical protein
MFVHHLTHRITQQHYELIKGLNLTLQLDAIDQIDGHWNPFLAQRVEIRVL